MIKKPLSLVLSLILMVLTAFPALANTNDMGITFIAELDKPTISVSAEAQTVVMTVKASETVTVDGIGGTVIIPEGWTLTAIENEPLEFASSDYNLSNGKIAYTAADAENRETEVLAIITYSVPANAEPGEYELGIKELELTMDYGEIWEADGTATVTLINNSFSVEAKGDIDYTVNGNKITIRHNSACRVGYLGEDGKYANILGVHRKDGSYRFTVPSGATNVIIVIAGDVNGDGGVTNSDKTRLNASLLGRTNLTAIQQFTADVNNDNTASNSDKTRLNASLLGRTTLAWYATEDTGDDIVIEDTTGNEDTEKDNLGNKYTEIVW